MEEWIQAKNDFVKDDVIRWTEALWSERPHNGRNVLLGEQFAVAKIVSISTQYVTVSIIESKITDKRLPLSFKDELVAHEVGKTIRKKKTTLLRNGLERQRWNDESARALLVDPRALKSS